MQSGYQGFFVWQKEKGVISPDPLFLKSISYYRYSIGLLGDTILNPLSKRAMFNKMLSDNNICQ